MSSARAASRLHAALIDSLRSAGHVRTPAVEAAFRAVPRHLFLPGLPLEEVYRDQAIVTKELDGIRVSSSSQPAIMAIMLEQLDVQPGDRVLEIGAGTGYNAALLAHLTGATGQVVTIDLDADTVDNARQHLGAAELARPRQDPPTARVEVICGDGGLGHPAGAPYDRIILTVGAWDIAPAWWAQLREGGRLVLPLTLRGPETQRAIAFDRLADHLASASLRPCGFMLLRGAFAGPLQQVPLGPRPGLRLVLEPTAPVDAAAVFSWLGEPGEARATDVRANSRALGGGLNLWLALHDSRFCALSADDNDTFNAPALYGRGGQFQTWVGLLGARGLSLLCRGPHTPTARDTDDWNPESPPFDLEIRTFGTDDRLGDELFTLVQAWDQAGRPNGDSLHVAAYPLATALADPPADHVVAKRWTQLVLRWT